MIGRVIAGKYRILGHLGEGGMGAVYDAEELGPQGYRRSVAIKRRLLEQNEAPEMANTLARRFVEEARVMALLTHGNLVQIVSFIEEEGEQYIVMEKMQGITARKMIKTKKPVAIELGAYIAVELLKGLSYLHNFQYENGQHAHLVHRDVSPQNIFLYDNGGVKLGDMGITKGHDAPWRKGTMGSMFLGNPWYASYEATAQDPDIRIDGRHDLYSLSVVLYELFAGKPPLTGRSSVQIHVLQHDVLEGRQKIPRLLDLVPNFPSQLDAVIFRGMSIRREDRYQSADEMAAALIAAVPSYGNGHWLLKQAAIPVAPTASLAVPTALPDDPTQKNPETPTVKQGQKNVAADEPVPSMHEIPSQGPWTVKAAGGKDEGDGVPEHMSTLKPERIVVSQTGGHFRRAPLASIGPTKIERQESESGFNPRNIGMGLGLLAIVSLTGAFVYAKFRQSRPAARETQVPSLAELPLSVVAQATKNSVTTAPAPPKAVRSPSPSHPLPVPVAAAPTVKPAEKPKVHKTPPSSDTGFILIRPKVPGQKLRQWVDDLEVWIRKEGYEVPPGTYKIRVQRESGEEQTSIVKIRAGQTKRISF